MPENKPHINELLEKYFQETATEEELRLLFSQMETYPDTAELEAIFMSVFHQANADDKYDPNEWESVLENILQSGKIVQMPARKPIWRQWWAAASVIALLGISLFIFWPASKDISKPAAIVSNPAEILPASNGAILTLADGSQIVLDTVKDGTLLLPGDIAATVKLGQIIYTGNSETTSYNSITTPNGRQYKVALPDGSIVWLNTASSLRYPTRFTESERRVELSGEAYFEVIKDNARPFYVSVNDQSEIEVLGTRFNINAYQNEERLQTTLLQGKVRVKASIVNDGNRKPTPQTILLPGQQASIEFNKANGTREPILSIEENANLEQVMAWKNGMFYFDGMSLSQVARQLERWYDIKVEIHKSMQDIQFGGSISNLISLQQLIEELEFMGVRARMEEGRRLLISP